MQQREYVHASLANNRDGGVSVSVRPADRKLDQTPRFGSGLTIEDALGRALQRPGIRFHARDDETQAEIAAFRERSVSLMIRDDEVVTLGFR